jgi:hypothetical protein
MSDVIDDAHSDVLDLNQDLLGMNDVTRRSPHDEHAVHDDDQIQVKVVELGTSLGLKKHHNITSTPRKKSPVERVLAKGADSIRRLSFEKARGISGRGMKPTRGDSGGKDANPRSDHTTQRKPKRRVRGGEKMYTGNRIVHHQLDQEKEQEQQYLQKRQSLSLEQKELPISMEHSYDSSDSDSGRDDNGHDDDAIMNKQVKDSCFDQFVRIEESHQNERINSDPLATIRHSISMAEVDGGDVHRPMQRFSLDAKTRQIEAHEALLRPSMRRRRSSDALSLTTEGRDLLHSSEHGSARGRCPSSNSTEKPRDATEIPRRRSKSNDRLERWSSVDLDEMKRTLQPKRMTRSSSRTTQHTMVNEKKTDSERSRSKTEAAQGLKQKTSPSDRRYSAPSASDFGPSDMKKDRRYSAPNNASEKKTDRRHSTPDVKSKEKPTKHHDRVHSSSSQPDSSKKKRSSLKKSSSELDEKNRNKGKYSTISQKDDESDESGNPGFTSRLFYVSPLAICTMCLCYILSILLCVWLGFFLHMRYFPDLLPSSVAQSNIGEDLSLTNSMPSSHPTTTDIDAIEKTPTLLSASPSSSIFPSSEPSTNPTSMPSLSTLPTGLLSDFPSSSPTSLPGCPDKLRNYWVSMEDDLITMKYEVVVYQGDLASNRGGGLLCVSLEYAGSAGWIGLALSEAKRDPQFGVKEAIIGMPGLPNTVAVAKGSATLGQQSMGGLSDGPKFFNPAKYIIPAGGIGKNGFSGPSLTLLASADKQTLVNGSVSVVFDDDQLGGVISDQGQGVITRLSFGKYLREPNEIEIDPFGVTLLLYAVASVDSSGEYDGNPDWKSTTLTLESENTIDT